MLVNKKNLLIVLIGLAFAVGSLVLALSLLGSEPAPEAKAVIQDPAPQPKPAPKAIPKVHILVAQVDLPPGKIVEPKDLRWQEWPSGFGTDDYFSDSMQNPLLDDPDMESSDQDNKNGEEQSKAKAIPNGMAGVVGKVLRYQTAAGQPITRGSVVGPGERGFLAAVLAPGMRAVTVPINDISGVAGFVLPGDRIDLIFTYKMGILNNDGDNDSNSFQKARKELKATDKKTLASLANTRFPSYHLSQTVLRNLRVLAIDQRTGTGNQARPGRTVTFEVTPALAERLTVLSGLGTLSMALRPLSAGGEHTTEIADLVPKPGLPTDKNQTGTIAELALKAPLAASMTKAMVSTLSGNDLANKDVAPGSIEHFGQLIGKSIIFAQKSLEKDKKALKKKSSGKKIKKNKIRIIRGRGESS